MVYFGEVSGAGFMFRGALRSRISVKRAYIKDCPEMTCAGAPLGPARAIRSRPQIAFSLKKSEVPDHGFLQLQHCCRIVSRRDPQEEGGGFRRWRIGLRGRSGTLRDRGIAGGLAERRLPAGR